MLRALPARDLLRAWEMGLSQPLPQRALTLLATSCPDTPTAALARLSIGRRDAQLLILRELTFGPHVIAVATCPACESPVELDFHTANIQIDAADAAPDSLALEIEGYHVAFRLPHSEDLLSLNEESAAAGPYRLLQRCMLVAQYNDGEVPESDLPASVVAAVGEVMAQSDPQADVVLALACPACEHGWLAPFDVLAFFWSELTAWAQRLLQEIHWLATVYGWSEQDILALSARRRRLYLEMIMQ